MPKFSANLSMLFGERPFLERFAAAREVGFEGVEYLFPYDYEAQELAERLREHGLDQVLHNLPAGDWEAGERGIAVLPERVDEFRNGVRRAIDYARALGCSQVNCLAGIAPEDADPDELRSTFVRNLRYAAERLAEHDITLLVEAINTRDIPGFYLTTTMQAFGVVEEVGASNLKLQYDVYHMQVMEGDLVPTIERNLDRIGHIQVADNPGRNEPGTGEIAYPFIFQRLDELGYDGWVGCEYKPAGDTVAGLDWVRPYLSRR